MTIQEAKKRMHTSNSCPQYLAENGQWASSMNPYCSCPKIYQDEKSMFTTAGMLTDKFSASAITCNAPTHTWKFAGTTDCTWVCDNCGLRIL